MEFIDYVSALCLPSLSFSPPMQRCLSVPLSFCFLSFVTLGYPLLLLLLLLLLCSSDIRSLFFFFFFFSLTFEAPTFWMGLTLVYSRVFKIDPCVFFFLAPLFFPPFSPPSPRNPLLIFSLSPLPVFFPSSPSPLPFFSSSSSSSAFCLHPDV